MRDGIRDRPALGGCVLATRSTANHANVFEGEEADYSNNKNNASEKKKENNQTNHQTIFFLSLSFSPSLPPCSLSSPTVAPISKVSHSLLMSIRLGLVCLLIVCVCVCTVVVVSFETRIRGRERERRRQKD